MKNAILIARCALLADPAIAETAAEKIGVNSTLGIAPTTHDFVQEAAIVKVIARCDIPGRVLTKAAD